MFSKPSEASPKEVEGRLGACAVSVLGWLVEIAVPRRLAVRVFALGKVAVLVVPQDAQLTPRLGLAVTMAQALAQRGAVAAATHLARVVQRDLGVTQDTHCAAVEATGRVLRAERRLARRQAAVAERERAVALNRPHRPAPLSPTTTYNLERAAEHREKAFRATDRHVARAALAEVRKHQDWAQNAHRTSVDAAWAAGALAETAAQARVRGDALESVRLEEGATLSTQDGLKVLFCSGAITDLQWKAGRAYRWLVQAARPSLSSNVEGRASVKAHPAKAALQRAYASLRLSNVEATVRALGERELRVLRWVAAMEGSINALGSGGNVREANLKALRRALDKAADVIWRMHDLRIRGN